MSRENVEVVRRVFEAFKEGLGRGDPGGGWDTGLAAEDAEWIPAHGFPGPSSYRGREGFAEFMRNWTEDFEAYSIQMERLIEAPGDRVVALIHHSGIGKGSRAAVETTTATIYTLDRGRVIRMETYLDPAEALKAAGLSE